MNATETKRGVPNDAENDRKGRKAIFGAILLAAAFGTVPEKVGFNDATAQGGETVQTDATRPGRRVVESNDGGLPAVESPLFFSADEEANLAERWKDPAQAAVLRKKVFDAARERRAAWPNFPEIDADVAAKLGVRRIEGKNVVLWTDLPKSADVDQIPVALSAALPKIATFFELDADYFADRKIDAFLIGDVDAFIRIGALDGPPIFLHGYSSYSRIFALDKGVGYYNRFLLLHELIHTAQHEIFGDLRPRWVSEGLAEYLALHRFNPKTKSIEIAQIPENADATPGFGRLRQIQEIVRAGNAPSLRDILNFEPRDYVDVATYAWSWAFVMFLENSPKYRDVVRRAPFWATADDPNRIFCETIGDRWGELEADWADFVEKIDYQYDFDATEIDATPGRALADAARNGVARVEIAANRGWQNSGIRLEADETVKISTSGRFDFFVPELKKTLDFEAPGATFEYLFGVPSGRLQAAVVPVGDGATFDEFYANADASNAGRNGFSDVWRDAVSFSNASATLTAKRAGTLYFRINAAPGNLAKNGGGVEARIQAVDAAGSAERSAKN